jgi:hypothetical protein
MHASHLERQLLNMLHSDMERMRVGGGFTTSRSQHPDTMPAVERLYVAASTGVRVLDSVVNSVRFE